MQKIWKIFTHFMPQNENTYTNRKKWNNKFNLINLTVIFTFWAALLLDLFPATVKEPPN